MDFKKITLTECLFAVIVIGFILVTMTFSAPYYNENYEISFDFQMYSLSAFILTTSIFVLLILYYFKINTLKELQFIINFNSSYHVLILVNINILFFVIAFVFDNFMHNKNWLDTIEFFILLALVPFLIGNLVAVFSVAFINFNSPKFFSIGKITVENSFGLLYFLFWSLLLFVLTFVLVYEGYPLIGVSMMIFGLIKVNLLSNCSY